MFNTRFFSSVPSRLVRFLFLTSLLISQTNCQPARWEEFPGAGSGPGTGSGKPGVPGDSTTPGGPGGGGGGGSTKPGAPKVYETRVPVIPARPLDMTWVIDNSESMTTEAAHVRRNFVSFVGSVKEESDLKVALISREGALGRDMSLPVSGANYLQINRYVWSTDSLEITAAAFCPYQLVKGSMCEQLRTHARTTDLGKIGGKLKAFLRADSKKAFVFVTDDRSRVPSDSFMKAFEEVYPGQVPVIYGFVGLGGSQSPCAANEGVQYKELASRTGGAVFNICDTDWSPAFKQLASLLVRSATAPIPLPEDLDNRAKIISVSVNGLELEASRYQLTPEGLVLDPSVTKGATDLQVRIEYEIP